MPSESGPEAPAQRLHPSSLLFGVGSAVRSLILPGLVLLFASRSRSYEPWLMLLFVPIAAGMLIRYMTYRYRLGPDEMVIREGILTRNERHVPYARIQNIDRIQNPLHRLFGVAVVRIETASGGKPEAEIKVLSLAAVNEMRERVFRDRPATRSAATAAPTPAGVDAPEPEPEAAVQASAVAARSLVRLPLRELVIFGVISNRGMVVVAAALGLMSQSGLFDVEWENWTPADLERFRWLPSTLVAGEPLGIALLVVTVVVVLVILMRLLSIVWAIQKFHGFSLTQRGDDLRAEYGLLTRVSATVPSNRIQLLSTQMSRLHRWFGRGSVQVETAGGGASGGEPGVSQRQWLAPVIPLDAINRLVTRVLPAVDLEDVVWNPIEARAWKRLFKRGLVWVVPVTVAAGLALRPWGLLIVLPALWLAYTHARRWVAATGYALIPGAILFKSGWWGQRMSVVRFSKIQALSLRQTPFDRRLAMSTLSVDTAGAGRAGHRIDIPFLATKTAVGIGEKLFAEASRTTFRW